MKEFDPDVILNADQTFVKIFPEETKVAAKKVSRRVGGKIKADVKVGITLMVVVELNSSSMVNPFIVFNGTKIKDAKNPRSTHAYKYRN
eukprot:1953981-Ditylum_brightwellii.AAC.1